MVAMVTDNAASLLRLARRFSLCDDDAADAYQRTVELYLGRVHRLDEATVGGWLRTVCKHEAMAIRAARMRVLTPEPVEWDERPSVDIGDAAERVESLERVERAAEALGACEPDEARAILLRAGGLSYRQISESCGWSQSRVGRSLASGRARFLARFAAIESGAACEAFAPTLSAIVDGEATPDDFLAIRPHLRHCAGCRRTLRALYEAEPALGALLPAGVLVAGGPGVAGRVLEALSAQIGERAVRAHAWIEAATATKAAAVVASAATVAAGGTAAAEHVARRPPPRPARVAVHHAPPIRLAAASATVTATPAATAEPAATSTPAATPSPSPSPAPTAPPTPEPPEFAATAVPATAPTGEFEATPVPARSAPSGEFELDG